MSLQTWVETLVTGQVDGTALTNTTPASIIPAASKITLPAGYFSIGKAGRMTVLGRISTLNPTPGTFTFDMRLGAVVAANGAAMALNTVAAKTNVAFRASCWWTCRAIGSSTSANLMFQWEVCSVAFDVTAAGTSIATIFGPASAPAVGTGFDSTASQTVDVFGTWSVNSASNTITVHQSIFESLN